MKRLAIQEVHLTHFRNYADARFSFGDRFNLVSGLNGQGKTNLLDAIYYLSVGKSYFSPYDQRVVTSGQDFFRLESSLAKGDQQHQLLIKVKPGSLKEIVVDLIPVNKISEHLGFIPIVFSAPRDIELVTGSSQSRRRYFDHLLCQVDANYLQALMQYNYLLQQRNAALKAGISDLQRMIQTYDEQMAPFAKMIFEKRQKLFHTYTPMLQHHYDFLSDKKEVVDSLYESQLLGSSYEIEADRSWTVDKNTQRSNAGIHKDDVDLKIKSLSAKEFGSQGQIKSLIFAMHLTKYAMLRQQRGYNPILVLDDIFDKLDDRRLHRLMEILHSDEYGQIFISDTSRDRLISGVKSDFMEILL